jgi:hypothetical protein
MRSYGFEFSGVEHFGQISELVFVWLLLLVGIFFVVLGSMDLRLRKSLLLLEEALQASQA